MKDINRETATSISFPQAIATTQSIMKQIEAGELNEEEIETRVTSLVTNKQGARGFFVAYLTGDLSLADNPSVGVINALKSVPHLVGELLVKNVAMSTAMAVTHRRNNDKENALESEKVARRSANLIKQLQSDLITKELSEFQKSLKIGEGKYQEFLDKWGYDAEQKEMMSKAIEQINCGLD